MSTAFLASSGQWAAPEGDRQEEGRKQSVSPLSLQTVQVSNPRKFFSVALACTMQAFMVLACIGDSDIGAQVAYSQSSVSSSMLTNP